VHTGPHGLTEDRSGNIWFTGNNAGLIGKLDPNTGLVTEYNLPDAAAKDPHTLIFDKEGILWFTVQQANRIGRLDPKSGEIKLVTSPTPKSRPYARLCSHPQLGRLCQVLAVLVRTGAAMAVRRARRIASRLVGSRHSGSE
jgi:streptogramin lyase